MANMVLCTYVWRSWNVLHYSVSLDTLFPSVVLLAAADNNDDDAAVFLLKIDVRCSLLYDMETITWLGKHSIENTIVVILIATHSNLTCSFLPFVFASCRGLW